MKYNLSKTTPPAMPRLGKGTESVALLLSQVSKDTQKPIVSMLFPILGAHVSGAEFMYPDLSWKETRGMMANLVADSGAGKGQLLQFCTCKTHRIHPSLPLKSAHRLPQAPHCLLSGQTSPPHRTHGNANPCINLPHRPYPVSFQVWVSRALVAQESCVASPITRRGPHAYMLARLA